MPTKNFIPDVIEEQPFRHRSWCDPEWDVSAITWAEPGQEWTANLRDDVRPFVVPSFAIPAVHVGLSQWFCPKPRIAKTLPERLSLQLFESIAKQKLEQAASAAQTVFESEDRLLVVGRELIELLDSINDLAYEPVEDESGLIRPSYHGLKNAVRLLLRLALKSALLRPRNATTDNNGDVRISWGSGDREIDLICPYEDSDQPYLYYSDESTGDFGVDPVVDVDYVAMRIRWALLLD